MEPSTELTSPEHPGRRPYSRSYRMFPLNLTFQQNREVLFASAEVPGQLRAGPKPRSGLSLPDSKPENCNWSCRLGRGAGPRNQLPSSYKLP